MIDKRFPTYHEKLIDDGFEPKWYIPRSQLSIYDLKKFSTGLARIVLIPGSLVLEALPLHYQKKPDEVYVGYVKSR